VKLGIAFMCGAALNWYTAGPEAHEQSQRLPAGDGKHMMRNIGG